MLYLAIATGTTTHRMLFLESPLNLPVLNISLPLLSFYTLTPVIFVIFHFYMLLNLVLLARTAKSFEDAVACAFPEDGAARETFRMRIENTLFVQLLVGARLEREGINAKLLSLMALITLALAPVARILYLEIKFLPSRVPRSTGRTLGRFVRRCVCLENRRSRSVPAAAAYPSEHKGRPPGDRPTSG